MPAAALISVHSLEFAVYRISFRFVKFNCKLLTGSGVNNFA